MIVLYVGTQLAASLITMIGGDKTQQRIMLALPFVFVPFIVNFEAGLILYWVTTNFWTIGQQLVVRKLYPKPVIEKELAGNGAAASRRKADRRRGRRRTAATARRAPASGAAARSPRARRRSAPAGAGSARDARRRRVPADDPATRLLDVVERVVDELELEAEVEVTESDEELRATVEGEDLGLLIGKHGTTIDALQHLAMRIALRGDGTTTAGSWSTPPGTASGARTPSSARRTGPSAEALRYGRPVELEPMRALERKVVHIYLSERTDIETHSEGDEPDRRLVVAPLRPAADS